MLLLSRKKVGLHNSAWKWGQVISRLKLVVCHQYRSICAVLIDPCNPRLPCAEPAWVSAPTALTNLFIYRVWWRGMADSLVVGLLLGNQLVFFPLLLPMFSRMGCQSFPFGCWKSACHLWCWIYSSRGVQEQKKERDEWWWVSDIVKTRKTSKLFLAASQIPGWLFHNSFLVPYK